MTGQKQPILLLSKFGHCISYEKVKEIETAQAELALLAQKTSSILPIQPMADDTKVNIIILLLYYIILYIILYYIILYYIILYYIILYYILYYIILYYIMNVIICTHSAYISIKY